ncbi:hypothetical protein AB0G06_43540 [Nonomuraea dietziae]|uniref:hypothetical protein n=1 Tax=Nonomuraea dietziae TaxID=65515 RepID=UPI0033F913B1
MIGFGSNAMGGTTVTDDSGTVGFTMRDDWGYYVAFGVRGENTARLGSYDTDRGAVSSIMRRRSLSLAHN